MKICIAQRVIKNNQSLILIGTCCLWAGLLLPAVLQAAQDITARYVQSQGTQLVIEITSGSNPPTSAILIQQLPPGVRILASQPDASTYNANKKSAKWLLRNLQPGTSTVSMTLDHPVSGADISAEIRFKPAQGGKMTTIRVER